MQKAMPRVIKKIHYHLQVYEILKTQILSGKLSHGEKINENRIAQEIGVSRSPVREALRMLEQDELVILCDSGLIVNPLDDNSLREIYECRIPLESYAAGLSTPYMTEDILKDLEESVKLSRRYHKEQQYDKVVEANTVFHDTITNLCQNNSLIRMIQKYSALFSLARIQIFTQYKRSEEPYLSEHDFIIEACRKGEVSLVESLMRTHIQGDYLLHMDLGKRETKLSKDALKKEV